MRGRRIAKGLSRVPAGRIMLVGSVVALCLVSWMAMVTIGRAPRQPSGPHKVAVEIFNMDISKPGQQPATPPVRIGLWQPLDAAPAGSWPLVIYAPGWGDGLDDNSVLVREIASHGYQVIAMDDIARDGKAPWATADGENARLARFDISTEDRQVQLMEDADRRVGLAAAKMSAVLDTIDRLRLTDPRFKGANLDRVAAVGASFGGATAAEAALTDGRIAMAINLDGLLFGPVADAVVPKPYIEFNSTLGGITPAEADSDNLAVRFLARLTIEQVTRQQRQMAARVDGYEVTMNDTMHSDFTDALYDPWRITRWRPWRGRPLRPARVRYVVDQLVVAALDEWMKRHHGAFTAHPLRASPHVDIEGGPNKKR